MTAGYKKCAINPDLWAHGYAISYIHPTFFEHDTFRGFGWNCSNPLYKVYIARKTTDRRGGEALEFSSFIVTYRSE